MNQNQTGNKDFIRDMNTRLILKSLIEDGCASRSELAGKLGLAKTTVSTIVEILMEKGFVKEIGSTEEVSRGRKPVVLGIEPNCGYVISVDLGTDEATFLVSNLMGVTIASRTTENKTDADTVLDFLIRNIAVSKSCIPTCRYQLVGISIGIHGVVHDGQVIFVPYSDYQGIDFSGELEKIFNVPVLLDNEANLSVLGEWAYCRRSPNMLSVSVHSGIGLGIIIENRLMTGQNGFAGEFGHTIVELDGRPCPCGNRGCLEQYASARVLLKEFSALKGRTMDADDLFRLYKEKDADAASIVETFVRYMTAAVSNLLTTFNPDIIVLNSTFTNHLPALTEEIQRRLQNRMAPYCRLVPSSLKDRAILLGGVYLCSRIFWGLTESSASA